MIQRGQHLGFAFKPGQPVGIARERLRQDFERHVLVELGVSGAIQNVRTLLAVQRRCGGLGRVRVTRWGRA